MALARKLPSKIYEIEAHNTKVTCLDIGETGRVLVTGGHDRLVNLFAFGNNDCSMSLEGHNSKLETVKFTQCDDVVYSADESGIIKKWDLNQFQNNVTYYGHMKSVRSLDFHPFGDYIVSGSNDTSVRLWDVRTTDCIKKYRGHIANVNSVKFSPDGSWIASAGTEGCVIIWDIRMSNKIIEFIENGSPVTCLQFHPYEFLLAAGRNDGTVDLYDLESKQMISRRERSNSVGNTVKCITFSEQGECLFVGTVQGVSVIGWEPDREFDRIESSWSLLGDMKVVNKKLICGGFENQIATVHAMNLNKLFPFYNPANVEFNHNQSSRKSFSKGNGKVRLSIDGARKSAGIPINDTFTIESGGMSSPNLSIEMIDEEEDSESIPIPPTQSSSFEFANYALSKYRNSVDYGNNLTSNDSPQEKYQLNKIIGDDEPTSTTTTTTIQTNVHKFPYQLPGELDNYNNFKPTNQDIGYSSDLDYYSNKNNILSNVSDNEDFPINTAQQPDYAPKYTTVSSGGKKTKSDTQQNRRSSPPNTTTPSSNIRSSGLRKSSNTSVSTMDLHKIDEQFANISITTVNKKPMSRGSSPIRNRDSNKIKKSESSYQIGNQQHHQHTKNNKNITVQFFNKPQRSKTAIDIKSAAARTHTPSSIPRSIQPAQQPQQINHQPENSYVPVVVEQSRESQEFQYLISYHDTVFSALCNRLTSLELIRNQTRSQDVAGALRTAIRFKDDSAFVDLLGAILEKKNAWNLDMCLLVLPQLHELLQTSQKFHFVRACDTLRIIIKDFLPVIQQNIDPWSPARSLGVDITREERTRKCIECRNWLIKIRCLPPSDQSGPSLSQLQNLIVDI